MSIWRRLLKKYSKLRKQEKWNNFIYSFIYRRKANSTYCRPATRHCLRAVNGKHFEIVCRGNPPSKAATFLESEVLRDGTFQPEKSERHFDAQERRNLQISKEHGQNCLFNFHYSLLCFSASSLPKSKLFFDHTHS